MAIVRNDTTLGMALLVFQGVEKVVHKCCNTPASLVAKMVASGTYASGHTGCRRDARPCGMLRAGMGFIHAVHTSVCISRWSISLLRLCMTIRCLPPALSTEKHVKVQDPPGSLTRSSGAKIKDLAQLLNEQVSGRGKHVEESSEERCH